ncbi:hypothetical protein [Limimaricola hongkongensis]|uniref:Uncharacterized protein n=1 Tax=Limimaricola hongkongensis DSM 17492 TaxID=1122180 RepID=A0A017HC89_9RHOB|nr:hypothetical protein [Limimaricola hongkongensis]EYD71773.1 hypothetical protein Lokhon_01843 [Limimaricola hongkongensis DSM 17492]
MAAATDSRLERLIRASEAAGKVVRGAKVDGKVIELTFGDEPPVKSVATDADLVNWKRK